MGLVEAGVGLIPGGGGCKEMTLRAIESAGVLHPARRRGEGSSKIFEALKKNFETIAKATVSTSAAEARALGFLSPSDRITAQPRPPPHRRQHARRHARRRRLHRAHRRAPTSPPPAKTPSPPSSSPSGPCAKADYISDHDAKVANWVAHILCGGKLTPGTPRQRTIPPRPRTRSLPLPLRRKENPGTHRLHPQNRQAAPQLSKLLAH